jgi:hypothetical protein
VYIDEVRTGGFDQVPTQLDVVHTEDVQRERPHSYPNLTAVFSCSNAALFQRESPSAVRGMH